MTRLRYNLRIMAELTLYAITHPKQRFGQILENLDIVRRDHFLLDKKGLDGRRLSYKPWKDEFYTESKRTLTRIRRRLSNLEV